MTQLKIHNFSSPPNCCQFDRSTVTEFFPDIHGDNRGYFFEVLKEQDNLKHLPEWYTGMSWIKQINRSSSSRCVIRGCHAQKGNCCQGKLVEAINYPIYDIITDARPDAESFGVSHIFLLDPKIHNQLWVPRGFLHSVVFPDNEDECDNIILQYFCDNHYSKEHEVGVNPSSLLPKIVGNFKSLFKHDPITSEMFGPLYDIFESPEKITYSSKDICSEDYNDFIKRVSTEYSHFGNLWYR